MLHDGLTHRGLWQGVVVVGVVVVVVVVVVVGGVVVTAFFCKSAGSPYNTHFFYFHTHFQ
jgi:hypothetical protein